ncbi:MAG TPA: DUF998 domain-containing protein [Streptosporangiaceae bacterium]|nr:DUF998 domain-containing protein [Streptosporangiaceae bacterium]
MTQAARQDPARAPAPLPPPGTVPGWAVISAAISPVLLVTAWVWAGAVQPASYSPMRQTVSVMAGLGGTDRWIMTTALLLVGGCHLITAAGLTALRPPARILLVIAGVSSVGIALFPEPATGSTPAHLAFTALGAAAIAIWPGFTIARTFPRPVFLSEPGAAIVTAVFLILLAWLISETQGGSDLGLAERLSSSVETCWPFVVAVSLWRAARRPGAGSGPGLKADDRMACPGTFR